MMELKYFNGPGRAEAIRILLSVSGASWKDTRFGYKDWPAIKPTTPLGSVPVLTIDGVDHCQSVALTRYAAKLARFYPQDPLDAMVVDEVLDALNEIMSKIPMGGEDIQKRREDFQKTVLIRYFELIEKRIQKFGGGDSVCGTPSAADVQLMVLVRTLRSGNWDHIDKDVVNAYPGIIACVDKISSHKKIQAYYESHNK